MTTPRLLKSNPSIVAPLSQTVAIVNIWSSPISLPFLRPSIPSPHHLLLLHLPLQYRLRSYHRTEKFSTWEVNEFWSSAFLLFYCFVFHTKRKEREKVETTKKRFNNLYNLFANIFYIFFLLFSLHPDISGATFQMIIRRNRFSKHRICYKLIEVTILTTVVDRYNFDSLFYIVNYFYLSS